MLSVNFLLNAREMDECISTENRERKVICVSSTTVKTKMVLPKIRRVDTANITYITYLH